MSMWFGMPQILEAEDKPSIRKNKIHSNLLAMVLAKICRNYIRSKTNKNLWA